MMMCSISISTALAEEVHSTSAIDPYIYELIDSYEKGIFQERNDLPELDIEQLFASQSLNAEGDLMTYMITVKLEKIPM